MSPMRPERTLARPATVEGRGYWSGRVGRVEFRPAAAGSGLRFVRDDLVGDGDAAPDAAIIPANVALRRRAERRTVLLNEAGADVAMVEHVLAALAGLEIDNCEIGVTASEMPAMDGSSGAFVEAIELAGVVEQAALAKPLVVRHPVRCGDDGSWIEARPPLADGLTIEYRLDFGAGSAIGRQWLVFSLAPDAFRDDIASARTFLLKSEADALIAQGLGSHVTPRDLLIFRDQPTSDAECAPIDNPLRFEDECVRHKVLDVIGDLALAGRPIVAHVVANCSGHRLNADLVEALLASHPQDETLRRSA